MLRHWLRPRRLSTASDSSYVPAEIIKRKREGRALSQAEISWVVTEYHKLDGAIRDYQMSAFLMAACVKGMTDREAADLTQAMLKTGDVIDLPTRLEALRGRRDPVVDKHSTGGVGDKVSLVVAPLAASLGLVTPMVSSRGLGHTGGTIDKLESIPGVHADLTPELFIAQLAKLGCGIVSTNRSVSPVENRIYGLRDTSGSVESPALIASSIMCKKLANSPDAVLLDVKTGRGAFMHHLKDSVSLARMMVAIGENAGVTTRALITNMEQPLGASVGNVLEVREALFVLNPRKSTLDGAYARAAEEVRELAVVHVASMLCMVGRAPSFAQAHTMASKNLKDGAAYDTFLSMVDAQGGDLAFCNAPDAYIAANTHSLITMTSPTSGKVKAIDAYKIGMASLALGSGRLHADDPIDHFACAFFWMRAKAAGGGGLTLLAAA